jgi:membrane protease YdiL (CAAX protease family)
MKVFRTAEGGIVGSVPAASAMRLPLTPTVHEELSTARLVALHLIPGALVTAGFVVFAPIAEALGFPPIAALLAAILLILVPVELGVVIQAGRRLGATSVADRLRAAVPYRRPLARRDWLWLPLVLLLLAFVGFGVAMPLDAPVINALFGWVPSWFVAPIPLDTVRDYSAGAWAVTLAAFLVLNGLVGPIVEETYFRGYLLPRMERYGRLAPLLNVTLFSIYHFWSPWQILARILGVTPFAYAVRWKQNIYLGMVVHCTLNVISVFIVTSLVASRL